MPREARKPTISALNGLRRNAESDPAFMAYVADAGQPGLYAWARRGRVRFVFTYRPPSGGARRRLKIDEYGAITLQQAREIAEDWRGRVAAGRDPQLEKRDLVRWATTLGQVTELYLEDLRERAESGAGRGKRSGYASAKNRLKRHVLPQLGAVRVREVTADQIRRLHRALKETPVEANRTLTALSAVFGYADRAELVPARFNPCRHGERFAEKGKRRALSLDELQAMSGSKQNLQTPQRVTFRASEGPRTVPSPVCRLRSRTLRALGTGVQINPGVESHLALSHEEVRRPQRP